ncbi:MAG: Ig-like domain-containing protein [Novosphingobium sp.]|jgi:hypothetical protein|nr:Ig-like domain-containing protein [Novosphingobium sp.]
MATQHSDLAGSVDVSPSSGVIAAQSGPTDYLVAASHGDVADYAREGQDLIVEFTDGQKVRLTGFFANGFDNHLVFSDGTVADFTQALTSGGDGVAEALVRYGAHGTGGAGKMGLLPILAGIAAGGAGIAVAASGGGSNNDNGSTPVTPTPTPTPTPTKSAPAGNIAIDDGDNDGRIELSGTARPGSSVTVTWPDGTTSTATTDNDGHWGVEATNPQDPNGKATVVVTEPGNSPSDPVITEVLADRTDPAAASDITVNDGDNDGRPELAGKAEPGATVVIAWPDGSSETTIADGNGNWTIEATDPQDPDGEATVTVQDRAGNDSKPVTVGLADETPPAAPGNVVVEDGDGDGLPEASGTAEPGALITVTWPDDTTSTATAGPDGTWSVESPVSQPDGEGKVTATDAQGNESGPTGFGYVDDVPPAEAGNITVNDDDNDGLIDLTGTAEPGSTIVVEWPDGTSTPTITGENGEWTIEAPDAYGPADEVTVTVKDAAGNASDPVTVGLEDVTAPDAASDIVANDGDNDGLIELSGKAEPGATVTIEWPSGTTLTSTVVADDEGNWSVEAPVAQDPNDGEATVTVRDAANNVSDPVSVSVADETAPEPAGNLVADDSDNDDLIALSGTAEPGATVLIEWPDGTSVTTTADGNGDWSVEATDPQDPAGEATVTVRDGAGNDSDPVTIGLADDTNPAPADNITVNDTDNDGRPELTGTAEPGATVIVEWPDGTSVTTTADGNGDWTIEAADPQAPAGEATVTVKDGAGNESEPVTVGLADEIAPADASNITANDGDNDGRPELTGTAEPGSVVTVTWPTTGEVTSVTADPVTGAWTIEAPSAQNPADGPATVTVTDAQDNESAPPVSVSIADQTAPAAPVVSAAADTDNDGLPTASGTAEPGSLVTVTWPDATTSSVIADPVTGAWSVESPVSQPNGPVTATATDLAGNTSLPSGALGYTDTIRPARPEVGIVKDGDGDGLPETSGTAEAGSTVTVYWPDGTTTTTIAGLDGEWSIEAPTSQPGGPGNVTATDAQGNESFPTAFSYIDVTPPAAPANMAVSDSDLDGRPELSGTAEPGSTVVVKWTDGTSSTALTGANGAWSVEAPAPQADGDFSVTAKDKAGNESAPPTLFAYDDSTAPGAPQGVSVTDADNDGLPTASGTAEAGALVTVTWPDLTTSSVIADAVTGAWSVEAPTSQPNGNVTATATDVAGNTGPASAPVGWSDTVAPASPANMAVADSDGDGRPELSGTAEVGSVVTVTWSDGTVSSVTAQPDGTWSLEAPAAQPDGTFTATASDAQGNTSTPATFAYDDTTPPGAPSNISILDPDLDGYPTITGKAEVGSTVTVHWHDGPATSVTVNNPDGSWTLTATTIQNTGGGYATATDVAGNTSGQAPFNYIDNSPPAAIDPLTIAYDVQDDTGIGKANGEGEPGATVTVKWPDGTSSTAIVGPGGTWTAESPDPVPSQPGTITVSQTDPAGNPGPETTILASNTPDAQFKSVSVSDGSNPFNTESGSIIMVGTAVPGSTVEISVQGQAIGTAVTDASGHWQSPVLDVSSLPPGYVATISVSVIDANGNVLPTVTRELVLKDNPSVETVELATLNTATGMVIVGKAGDAIGNAFITDLGDINGDGISDIIFGAPGHRPTGSTITTAGYYVLFGHANGSYAGLSLVNGTPTLDLSQLQAGDGFIIESNNGTTGATIGALPVGKTIGDINGDGINDFAFTASGADPNNITNAGEIYIIYGQADGIWDSMAPNADGVMSLNTDALNPNDGFIIQGQLAGQAINSMRVLDQDFDGDGLNDYILQTALNGVQSSAVLFSSALSPTQTDGAGRAIFPLDGSGLIDSNTGINLVGTSAAYLADINNDGALDLLQRDVGTPLEVRVKLSAGGQDIWVDDGAGHLVLDMTNQTYDVILTQVGGNVPGVTVTLTAYMDFNNDGINDILMRSVNAYGTRGALGVYYGRDEGVAWGVEDPNNPGVQIVDWSTMPLAADGFTIIGANPGDNINYGEPVQGLMLLGDVNGDGYRDLSVSTAGFDGAAGANTGAIYIVFGRDDGNGGTRFGKDDGQGHDVLDLANFQAGDGIIVEGINAGDALASSNSVDINHDGIKDILFSGGQFDLLGGTNTGGIYVVYGAEDLGGTTITAAADFAYVTGSAAAGDHISDGGHTGTFMFGFGGNDVFTISNTDFSRIDGGSGSGDTVVVSGNGLHLDLTALEAASPGIVTNIDEFDITGGVAGLDNELTIGLDDVLMLSDSGTVQVRGDSGDVVNAAGFTQGSTFTDTDGTIYDVWTASNGTDTATLLIQQVAGLVVNH